MFQVKVTSNFDAQRMHREACNIAARNIEQTCKRAAAPYGGVTVTIKRDARGMPNGVSLEGSDAAIEAAKKALEQ